MVNLTKEYFDKSLDKALSNQTKELKAHAVGLQEELAGMTARGFEDQTKILTAHADTNQAELARMISKGFEDVTNRLEVDERMAQLEREFAQLKKSMAKVSQALNIKE